MITEAWALTGCSSPKAATFCNCPGSNGRLSGKCNVCKVRRARLPALAGGGSLSREVFGTRIRRPWYSSMTTPVVLMPFSSNSPIAPTLPGTAGSLLTAAVRLATVNRSSRFMR
ncbi:hypothetical protein D3C78_1612950 [compost metagenome]